MEFYTGTKNQCCAKCNYLRYPIGQEVGENKVVYYCQHCAKKFNLKLAPTSLKVSEKNREFLEKYQIQFFYHFTVYTNLRSILEYGLLAHTQAHKLNLVVGDISREGVQFLRGDKVVYRRPLHSYVCLYFSPKNPMLFNLKHLQDYLVMLAIRPEVIFDKNTILSDGNAAAKSTNFYRDIAKLDKLNWTVINGERWSEFEDGKRCKCAEVLVYPRVGVENIAKVICRSEKQVEAICQKMPDEVNIPVEVKPELFF